jgi:protein TonB
VRYDGPLRLLIVATAHVLAFWVIASALNVKLPASIPTILEVVNLQPPRPPTPDPPPAVPNGLNLLKPVIEPIPSLLPPLFDPDIAVEAVPPTDGAITEVYGPLPAEPPLLLAASIDPRHPLTQPDYPPSSIRLAEQGVVELDLHIAANGRVIEARMTRSSGFSRLDAAAIAEALRAWQLRPATRNGVALDSWRHQRVNFQLQDLR